MHVNTTHMNWWRDEDNLFYVRRKCSEVWTFYVAWVHSPNDLEKTRERYITQQENCKTRKWFLFALLIWYYHIISTQSDTKQRDWARVGTEAKNIIVRWTFWVFFTFGCLWTLFSSWILFIRSSCMVRQQWTQMDGKHRKFKNGQTELTMLSSFFLQT